MILHQKSAKKIVRVKVFPQIVSGITDVLFKEIWSEPSPYLNVGTLKTNLWD